MDSVTMKPEAESLLDFHGVRSFPLPYSENNATISSTLRKSGRCIVSTGLIVLLVVLAVLAIAIAALYFLGRKAQKKQAEQQEQINAMKQTVSMLIIDKKRMKIKDSGLPQAVIAQTPKMLRGSKLPIVKAKIGPQIMTLVSDEKIFELIPVKKEVKATVSGIYITDVKGLHGKPLVAPKKKKGRFRQALEKAQEKAGAKPIK